MKCTVCGGTMKPLFISWYCPTCEDKTTSEEKKYYTYGYSYQHDRWTVYKIGQVIDEEGFSPFFTDLFCEVLLAAQTDDNDEESITHVAVVRPRGKVERAPFGFKYRCRDGIEVIDLIKRPR